METKFTEGKWSIIRHGFQNIVAVSSAYIAIVLANHVGKKEAEANAKLISAAPDLLNACRLVMSSPRGETLSFQTLKALHEAIEKATN